MKKIYLITDTHFFHAKMTQLCARPENFSEIIFRNLSAIPETDVLIHLGDICMGHDTEAHEKYIMPLKCKKWLVKGNHDSKSNQWYLEHGWDFVAHSIVDTYFGKKVLFTHIPALDGNYDINIHGHLHNTKHRDDQFSHLLHPKNKLLAIENTNYKPVLLEHFLQ